MTLAAVTFRSVFSDARLMDWTWYGFALIFGIPLWFALASSRTPAATLLTVAYGLCYLLGAPWARKRSWPWRLALSAATLAMAAVLVLQFGLSPWNLSYSVAVLALILPWWWSAPASGIFLVTILVADAYPQQPEWKPGLLVMIVASIAPLRGLWEANRSLERSAETAVVQDRERLARDLHDILGATLTTITVKAGLARRLLEDGINDQARHEVSDIEELGRVALTEVRAAVAANHVLSLTTAIADAQEALQAAGIRADLPGSCEEVDTVYHQVFAYVLREGVTNVIRHSKATRCTVRMGQSWLEITDNGRGSTAPPGNGLAGLARRVGTVGCRITTRSGPGYRLQVTRA